MIREQKRGHTHVGGVLGCRDEGKHFGAETVAIVGLAVAAIGTGVSAYAASEQAHQQQEQARYNRKVAENQQAYALEQGRLQAEAEEDKQRHIMAAQHVAYAASGVVTEEGTPLLVAMDSARRATKDLQLIKYGTDVRASGWSSEAMLLGIMANRYGQQRATNAGVSLLGGLSTTAAIYAAPSRYGTSPTSPSTRPARVTIEE